MKWKYNDSNDYNPDRLGETRIKNCFAFIPTKLDNDDVIWLEKYKAIETYGYTARRSTVYSEGYHEYYGFSVTSRYQ